MRRITRCSWICLAFAVVGCNITNKLSFKPKKDPAPSNAQIASSTVGSAEFSTSATLKDPVKARLAYASWLEQSENYKEARQAYLKVLEKNSKDTEALLGLARIDRAYGREAEADAQLKKAQKFHPKDPKVLLAIGQVHASKGELDEAIEKMQAAHESAPYEKLFEYHLAVVEARAGQLEPALEHFTRSVGKAEAHYNIGFILSEQGHKAEAERYLVQALKLKPELKKAESALAAIRGGNAEGVQPASYNKK